MMSSPAKMATAVQMKNMRISVIHKLFTLILISDITIFKKTLRP